MRALISAMDHPVTCLLLLLLLATIYRGLRRWLSSLCSLAFKNGSQLVFSFFFPLTALFSHHNNKKTS